MAVPTPRKRTLFHYTEEPIAILVHHGEKIFINPNILTANSKLFQRALSDTWRSPDSFKVFDFNAIAQVDVEIFKYYANWCQHGDLDLIVQSIGKDKTDVQERTRLQFHRLTEIFWLADVVDDKALRNTVMDKILYLAATTGHRPGDITIAYAFEYLPETSSLCHFLVADGLSGSSPDWLEDYQHSLPEAYLKKLLFGWARKSVDKTAEYVSPVDDVLCEYHEHDEDLPSGDRCPRIPAEATYRLKERKKKYPKPSLKRKR